MACHIQIIHLCLFFLTLIHFGCFTAVVNDEKSDDKTPKITQQELERTLEEVLQSIEYSQENTPVSELDGIPKFVYEEIANLTVEEILKNHVVGGGAELLPLLQQVSPGTISIAPRESGRRRASDTLKISAQAASCEPRLITVALSRAKDPMVVHYPWCVELSRCSGCCYGNQRMSCQPVDTRLRTFYVLHLRLMTPGAALFSLDGNTKRILQEHLSCNCGCRVTQDMCTDKQRYDPERCACLCKNKDRVKKCPWNKHWDNRQCACLCKEERPTCLEDEVYNEKSCGCNIREFSP